jgi:hypothetical protein
LERTCFSSFHFVFGVGTPACVRACGQEYDGRQDVLARRFVPFDQRFDDTADVIDHVTYQPNLSTIQ